jgi:hypothetical protein
MATLDVCDSHFARAPIEFAYGQRHPLRPCDCVFVTFHVQGWECLKVNWAIWIPAQIFNFTCVPTFLRVPFVSLTSFGWTMILSTLQGTLDDDRTSPATKVTTAA